MPYIKQVDRRRLEADGSTAENEGELNYWITSLCRDYVEEHGGPSYATFNAVVGALECVKQEFYRRAIVPYENQKCEENGDVY